MFYVSLYCFACVWSFCQGYIGKHMVFFILSFMKLIFVDSFTRVNTIALICDRAGLAAWAGLGWAGQPGPAGFHLGLLCLILTHIASPASPTQPTQPNPAKCHCSWTITESFQENWCMRTKGFKGTSLDMKLQRAPQVGTTSTCQHRLTMDS